MEIAEAQRDVRRVFLGGFAGQLVSSVIWFASAAVGVWKSPRAGMALLVIVGFFIFPLTQLVLRVMRTPTALPKGHPMNGLGMQVAFVLPLILPLVFAATAFRTNWFYPALMIALGVTTCRSFSFMGCGSSALLRPCWFRAVSFWVFIFRKRSAPEAG